MSFSIPNQALRGRDPTCKLCGHRKTPYVYKLTRQNMYTNSTEEASTQVHLCNHCDFNLPYDEAGDGK